MISASIDQIRAFVEVVNTGSFTKGAKELAKAKSAIRYGIGIFEDQLGFKLLDRDAYRPTLTKRGADVYEQCKMLLESYEVFQKNCQQISLEIEHSLAISVSDIFGTEKILPCVRNLMEDFPKTEILLEREILSGEKMLSEGLVDIAIFESIKDTSLLDYKKITQVELVLVLHKDHPFLQTPTSIQSLEGLYSFPQIAQRSTLPGKESPGVMQKSRVWRVTDTLAKKELIASGLGWGRLPRHNIVEELKRGEFRDLSYLAEPFFVDIYVCRRKREHCGKVSQAFWEMFPEIDI